MAISFYYMVLYLNTQVYHCYFMRMCVFSCFQEAQQNSLLGMEMADYERLVKELNIKVSQGESDIAQLKAQIATHVQSEESFQQQIGVD